MFSGLRFAIGMLTIIPVQPPSDLGARTARRAMVLAPLAVLPVSLLAALAGWGTWLVGLPAALAGLVTVAAMVLGTRAMHADGLADTVDALGSARPRERALEIMKSGDVGPMGTTALVLVNLAQVLAAAVLVARPWGWLQLAVVIAVGRGVLVLGCLRAVPAARPGGLGAMVAGSVPGWVAVVEWLPLAAASCAVALLAGQRWWWPIIGIAVALAVVAWLLRLATRRLGGITGDILGATVELSTTVLLMVAAV